MSEKTLKLNMEQIPIEKNKLEQLFNQYFQNRNIENNLMNYDKTHHIELRDMGNDRETWFLQESSSKKEIEIADYNYRNKPSFMDYSPKYRLFFYILSNWSYKKGTHYYLHIHYKENFYECYLSYENYASLTISPCGEKLIISIRNLAMYDIPLKYLPEALENNKVLNKGKYYMDSQEFEKKRELERKNDEAKMAYRINYPNEFGDD